LERANAAIEACFDLGIRLKLTAYTPAKGGHGHSHLKSKLAFRDSVVAIPTLSSKLSVPKLVFVLPPNSALVSAN
jgi:hypothetical protein